MDRSTLGRDLAWGMLLLALGLGVRVAFALLFPTIPASDFRGIIDFALDLRDKSLFVPGYYWDVFNIGPPLALSLVLRVFPDDPAATARMTTAVWCGLLPVLPFVLWRGALPLWVRNVAGFLLALWPGQVLFSSVVAQDNWVLVPTVALGCLAVPPLLDARRRAPVAAGLLYALAVLMRQEMLYALWPLALGAAGLTRREGWRARNVAACGLAVALPFLALAAVRQQATGQFGISTGHAGITLLGTVTPGATAIYWQDPISYVASVRPELVRDRQALFGASMELALDEVRRRPGFQLLRVATMAVKFPIESDSELLYWAVVAPNVLPDSHRARGEALARRAGPLLRPEMIVLQALALATLILGIARRNRAILILALAALLKIGLHAVIVSAGRLYLPATALELPMIALGFWEATRLRRSILPWAALAAGTLASFALAAAGPRLYARVRSLDTDDVQRTYRFTLTSYSSPGVLECTVRQGRLVALGVTEAVFQTLRERPQAGDRAAADCTLTQPGLPAPVTVQVLDDYAPGGKPGRMLQRLEIDGREVIARDLAATPGTGWADAPAGLLGPGIRRQVRVEVVAVAPDQTTPWGGLAATRIRLAP